MNALGLGLDSAVGPSIDILTGLEMHLKLDDAADVIALDSSGNNKQGIITIAGATWGSGKINGGMEFDGVSGQLTFWPDSVVLGTTWTISGWLKPNSQTATYGAIATNGGASAGLWYQGSSAGANAGKLSFYYNSERRSTIALNNNEWNHFVLVNDAGTLTYYINNVAAGTYAGSGGPYNIQKIGSDLVNILKGAVDDFRVYSIALNEDQIAALFHYTEAPPTISAETQQFIDRLITPPAWVMERAYAEFIDGLVNAGLWTKLDALYLMPVNDPSYSMVNLMQDRFPLDLDIVSNNIAFTANSGWLSDGNGARIITPEKLLGAANLKCSLNDMCLFVYTAINSALSGVYDVRAVQDNGTLVEALSIYTLYTGGFVGGYVNSATESYGTGATNGSGMFIAQRVDSTHQDIYRNNVVVSTTPATANSTAFPDACPGIWPWRRPRVWGFGKALNGTERGALQTLIEAFVTKRTGGTP